MQKKIYKIYKQKKSKIYLFTILYSEFFPQNQFII